MGPKRILGVPGPGMRENRAQGHGRQGGGPGPEVQATHIPRRHWHEEIAGCQERDPQFIPRVSIEALSVGPDGLVAPAVGRRANETAVVSAQDYGGPCQAPGCWATGKRRTASTGGRPGFSRFRPGHGSAGARVEKSGPAAWLRGRRAKGGYSNG